MGFHYCGFFHLLNPKKNLALRFMISTTIRILWKAWFLIVPAVFLTNCLNYVFLSNKLVLYILISGTLGVQIMYASDYQFQKFKILSYKLSLTYKCFYHNLWATQLLLLYQYKLVYCHQIASSLNQHILVGSFIQHQVYLGINSHPSVKDWDL